ncbi:feruloyl CoA ortho-hydroxylase 2 isoform X2 [Ananas comosus]|uniref:Feruloyl CoA ortho-hydroxylase 2 isoform X2 n=1 Tax=Ananas comosus TaxID=4615 RepID=A0A6P5G0B2_ANACO|nr:feruloyl CoA ortho-hydroxylase 2 isoform X2 [Ananas comosus]
MAKSLWASTPPKLLEESRAPPPSPIAHAQPSDDDPYDDDEMARFLRSTRSVPKLTLPRTIPAEIDVRGLLDSGVGAGSATEKMKSAAAELGCFQILGHGVPPELVAAAAAAEAMVRGSPEEERRGEEEEEEEEEEIFWWSKGERRERSREETAGTWPGDSRSFYDQMDDLCELMNKIAIKIEETLEVVSGEKCAGELVLHLHKHNKYKNGSSSSNSRKQLKHEALKLVIKSLINSHAMCLHVCQGASGFCMYTKRGWVNFCPSDKAIVVTIGDQIQARSNGLFRSASGKPIYDAEENLRPSISVTFIHSHPTANRASSPTLGVENTISLYHQLVVAVCLALLYSFISFLIG